MKSESNLIMAVAGFVGAIFLCSFFKIGITFSLFLIFLSGILFLYRKVIAFDSDTNSEDSPLKSRGETSKFNKTSQQIFLVAILFFFFALGVARYDIADSKPLDANLENNVGNKVLIYGVISDEPIRKEKQAILTVDFKNIILASSSVVVSGRGVVSADLYPELKYGDLINISGKLEKPENFSNLADSGTTTNPSQIKSQFDGASFDYVSYLGKDDIFYQINFAKAELVSSGHGNPIKSFLFNFKDSFINNISKTITEPESSLLGGILIGAKKSIDKNTSEIFRKAGLSHIVVLSGYNITVVTQAIMKTLSFLPRNIGFFGGVIGIILFVIMSGASSTAMRAGIMALIVILADVTHRNYQVGRALIATGLLMVMINPKILVFDISFQLSFLATLAIIYISPLLKIKFYFITEKFSLRDTISATISAQILVLPLILYKMGTLSLVALPTNILIVAFIPAVMLFGFVTGALGFIWLPLSLPFAWTTFILLAYIFNVANFFASLPFSTLNISWFSSVIMTAYYFLIAIWIIYQNKRVYPTVEGCHSRVGGNPV